MPDLRQNSTGIDASCYLLNIPTEIRLHIYSYYIADHPVEPLISRSFEGIRLAQVCRFIRAEFLPEFWKRTEFRFHLGGVPQRVRVWEHKIGQKEISKIQVISMWNGHVYEFRSLRNLRPTRLYGMLTAQHAKVEDSEGWADTITLKFHCAF